MSGVASTAQPLQPGAWVQPAAAPFEPEIFGRFYLIDRIASGGMADVYKAMEFGHDRFESVVALKRIRSDWSQDPAFRALIADEARVSVGLRHPNIVRTQDFGQEAGHVYLSMELVEGRDLDRILTAAAQARTRLPPPFVAWIGLEACKGLHYAHTLRSAAGADQKLVHRDVSPANLLVTFDGHVKVADFGIVQAHGTLAETLESHAMGKPGYMSPEHAAGLKLDARADIYALGVVLYEAITGRRAFPDGVADAATRKALPRPRQLNPATPQALEDAILQAMSPDRGSRFASAREFGEAIRMAALADTTEDAVREALGSWLRDLFAADVVEESARFLLGQETCRQLHDDLIRATVGARVASERRRRLGGMAAVLAVAVLALSVGSAWSSVQTPDVPTVAVARSGTVEVTSEPAARVYLAGRAQGEGTSVTLQDVPAGSYELTFEADDHYPVRQTVQVPRGGTVRASATLRPIPKVDPATLSFDSRPTGAKVFVDGQLVGRTPTRKVLDDPPDRVRVVFQREGFADEVREVRVGPGRRSAASVVMKPGPSGTASTAPIKARVGKLKVTLQGVSSATVWVDGVRLGLAAPFDDRPVSAGQRTVRVENAAVGLDVTTVVEVPTGGVATVEAGPP